MKPNDAETKFNIKLQLLEQEKKLSEYLTAHFEKKFITQSRTGNKYFLEFGLLHNFFIILSSLTLLWKFLLFWNPWRS